MTKDIPLEKDYRHWKEKFEMAERRHASEIERWQATSQAIFNHAMTLGHIIQQMLNKPR